MWTLTTLLYLPTPSCPVPLACSRTCPTLCLPLARSLPPGVRRHEPDLARFGAHVRGSPGECLILLCCPVRCCAVLCCAALCCAVLCCAVLFGLRLLGSGTRTHHLSLRPLCRPSQRAIPHPPTPRPFCPTPSIAWPRFSSVSTPSYAWYRPRYTSF